MSRGVATFPRWVLAVSAAIALSSALPHVWKAATCPDEMVFTGFVGAQNDQNIYLMWCRQAREGRVLLNNLATAEETEPIFVGLHWIALGTLARFVPVPLIALYRVLAVLLAFIYLLILWRVMCEVFRDRDSRLFAFVIASVGSGFGAITDAINVMAGRTVVFSADIMPELWAYHSFRLPHFTLALCAMGLLVLFLLRAQRTPSVRLWVAAAAAGFVMTAVHPYDIIIWGPLLVVHGGIVLLTGGRAREVAGHLAALIGVAIPAAFYAYLSHVHPLLEVWAEQNVLRSPSPVYYVIGLGVAGPLAILGYRVMDQDRRPNVAHLALTWIAVTAVAAYSYPIIPFERRAVEGVHIPLAILAGAALGRLVVPWLSQRISGGGLTARRAALVLLLAAILPTNVKLLIDPAFTDEHCLPRPMVNGFEWIEANTPGDARIFCDMRVGQFACRYALRHVHAGHLQLTVEPDSKRESAREFFAPETAAERRREILREAGCGWVLATGPQLAVTESLPWLEEVFREGATGVYRFSESPPPPRLPGDTSRRTRD